MHLMPAACQVCERGRSSGVVDVRARLQDDLNTHRNVIDAQAHSRCHE